VGTVSQDTHQRNYDRQPRWDRCERADLFAQYRELRAQGLSQRQVAQELQVPRTTLQAWRTWHDSLDICPHVAEFFQSGPGLAFVHRLVVGFHLVGVEVGACGMRLACLFLTLTGLDRFVAASYGAPPQVNGQVAAAMVAYRHTETARWAKDMPRQDLTVTQDETLPGGRCLGGSEPVSTGILLEQRAQRREQVAWNARMAPALAQRNCHVMPSTSDAAPGLLAYVTHHLEAHHAPEVFHGQQALRKAVCAPMATQERAAHTAATEAQEQRNQVQAPLHTAGDEPAKRGPGRPPTAPVRLEQAQQEFEAASREHERLAQQREHVAQSLRGIGHDDHVVDLERGVRRNGQRIAADIHAPLEQVRAIAQHEGLSQRCVERMEKAERVVPNMQATIAFVSGYGRQQVDQLDLTPPASFAMHAKLIPA
jgi:DNA-binding XRE family transcriptional regulator